MRKIGFLMLAIAALAFSACTNDDVVVSDDATNNIDAGGDGYVAFTINLPTTPSTRAANDQFDNGTLNEYKVNDATLLLFTLASDATTEGQAKLFAAYSLQNTFANEEVNTTNQNVTTSATITQEISRPSGDAGDLYALVVLNKTGILGLTGNGESASGHFGNVTLTPGSTTFADLYDPTNNAYAAKLSEIANVSGSNFYMTNAPLFNSPGGDQQPDGTVSTLVKIDNSKIKTTADAAAESPAAKIFVERGVAKVTVDASNISTNTDEGYIAATINGYTLDLTNTVMCPVRDVAGANWWTYESGESGITDPYRFVGSAALTDANGSSYYRTYWGIDPNYDAMTSALDSIAGSAPATADLTSADGSAAMYCMENTFDVERMRKTETTRVIISATINNGTAFFTVDGASTILDKDGAEAAIKSDLEGEDLVFAAMQVYTGSEADFLNCFTVSGLTDLTESTDSVDFNITISEGLTSDKFSDDGTALTALTEGLSDIIADLKKNISVAYYAGGVSYYPVMIQHFGDDLTPWNAEEVSEHSASYPENINSKSAAENWLGRYGVLRNNWYELNVKGVKNVGYPVVPEPKDEYDDPVDSYIAVEIDVLSWAVRTQDVTL